MLKNTTTKKGINQQYIKEIKYLLSVYYKFAMKSI